jgi:uncharacterized protein (DUF4415 family)
MPLSEVSKARLKEIEAISDSEIDTSEIPELDEEFWQNAKIVMPKNYLRVDLDILEWFKMQGKDYQALINAVLRDYIAANLSKNGR